MKSRLGEFALVLVAAWSVAVVALNGFFLDSLTEALGWWGRALLTLGAVALLLVVLYAATRSRRQIAGGIVLYVALLVIFATAALAMSTGGNFYDDVEGNYLYLFFVLAASATGCFVLTRTLPGCAIWLALASLVCSIIQAFYRTDEYVMSLIAVLAALALIVHKNFYLGLEKADAAGEPSPKRNFVASAAPALAVGAAALVLWFGVIAPLGPGEAKISLVTEYRRLPIEQLRGTAEEQPVLDYSMTTENLVDGFRYTTDDLKEDPLSSVTVDARAKLEQEVRQQAGGTGSGAGESAGAGGQSGGAGLEEPDPEDKNDVWEEMSWLEKMLPGIIAALIVLALTLLIAGYFLVRRVLRKRRLYSYLSLPPRAAAEKIYLFLLERLSRIGFKRPESSTLSEFATSSARQMDMLVSETGVPFGEVTQTYLDCAYGREEPDEEKLVPLVAFYLGFWKGARVHLGNMKYFFKSFRL